MNQKELIRIVRKLQRQSRLRQPRRKNVFFDQKGVLGKGVQKKYSTAAIGDIMKKIYGQRRKA
jgi:hypothetical protein|tara:strand:+ start:209 stop:397 length:189 start_codon:yes stop_codon:yes gene_type:complete